MAHQIQMRQYRSAQQLIDRAASITKAVEARLDGFKVSMMPRSFGPKNRIDRRRAVVRRVLCCRHSKIFCRRLPSCVWAGAPRSVRSLRHRPCGFMTGSIFSHGRPLFCSEYLLRGIREQQVGETVRFRHRARKHRVPQGGMKEGNIIEIIRRGNKRPTFRVKATDDGSTWTLSAYEMQPPPRQDEVSTSAATGKKR